MKRLISSFFITGLLTLALVAKADDPNGKDIFQKQKDMDKGYHDDSSTGKMAIVSSSGQQTIREFTYSSLEETGSEGQKSMIKITAPSDMAGIGLLSYQNIGREDDQWLYMPAMKKTKRISGSSQSGNFLGSDITYEDLSPWAIDDYDFKFVKSEACGDATCSVVEMTPKKESQYSKNVAWVRMDNYRTTKMDLFDKKGNHFKTVLFENYQKINGKYWKPYKITMKDLSKNRYTTMDFSKIEVGKGLKAADFTTNVLER